MRSGLIMSAASTILTFFSIKHANSFSKSCSNPQKLETGTRLESLVIFGLLLTSNIWKFHSYVRMFHSTCECFIRTSSYCCCLSYQQPTPISIIFSQRGLHAAAVSVPTPVCPEESTLIWLLFVVSILIKPPRRRKRSSVPVLYVDTVPFRGSQLQVRTQLPRFRIQYFPSGPVLCAVKSAKVNNICMCLKILDWISHLVITLTLSVVS